MVSLSVGRFVIVAVLSVVQDVWFVSAGSPLRPLKRLFGKKEYTPLVFFKTPPGMSPDIDEMERIVSEVENELDVRIERVDVVKDPAARATLSLLTTKMPPFLYHRESLQTISVEDPESRAKKEKKRQQQVQQGQIDVGIEGPLIDKDQVRAWAKGRYLPPPGARWNEIKAQKPTLVEKADGNTIEQAELLKDSSLTPLQQEGKKKHGGTYST
eukprot:CAMPEP_0113451416 /NCGR_PEP_ID=MMETSP0014_2-20120614/6327_1 /TAXON_ID=2857 /ORGANISM="Nitzschia sp." /LENGTH=212 /DNA_ID=CAMNT_0000342771 /DNA_START=120 /DNA_END=758 /DNA_ORIENTATION=- /assembly_acc=CAM_ASM_000159